MTKKDWIILRLLTSWVRQDPRAPQNPDCARTINYLCKKHGKRKVMDAIAQLPVSR